MLKISREEALPRDIEQLVTASLLENFRAVRRLRDDWNDGSNRFSGRGEQLFEARLNGHLVGICGLNRDPYADLPTFGRVRRLYVAPASRLRGVGRALVSAVLAHAASNFPTVRVRTGSADADHFYLALGFERTARTQEATHQIQLGQSL